jgi:hypothetical protein
MADEASTKPLNSRKPLAGELSAAQKLSMAPREIDQPSVPTADKTEMGQVECHGLELFAFFSSLRTLYGLSMG